MAELVDAIDSKSISARSAGSIPARGTTDLLKKKRVFKTLPFHFAANSSCFSLHCLAAFICRCDEVIQFTGLRGSDKFF